MEEEENYKNCSVCGKKFKVTMEHRTICSKKCKEKKEKMKKEKGVKKKNEELVEIAVRARGEGMSYGQYVAKYKK